MTEDKATQRAMNLTWDIDGARASAAYIFGTGKYGVVVTWREDKAWKDTTFLMTAEAVHNFYVLHGQRVNVSAQSGGHRDEVRGNGRVD